jgi:hypothetical protein
VAGLLLCALLGVRYGLGDDVGRRYLGIAPMLLGVLVLGLVTVASARQDGPGPAILVPGVAVSVCLVWWGYRVWRSRPRDSLAETLLAMQAAPAPSAAAVRPEEVLGPWRFYVDAAASTVTIDLHGDGRYTQVIVGNRGERTECPGGDWTLDGPYVELTSYRSAARKVARGVRWFFGQWEKGLVLFAKDDPQGERSLLGLRAATSPLR